MKILQINKFFYPRGGTETYLFALIDLLKKNNHRVVVFSQANDKNRRSDDKKYFISDLELGQFNWPALLKIGRMFWSPKSRSIVRRIITEEKPDLVHIHNIYHQISPSILPLIKRRRIPIVMTIHDFKLIKHDYTLRADKKTNSWPHWSGWLLRAEFLFHWILGTYRNNVDLFIAPSQFVKNRLLEKGFAADKIAVIPHFLDFEKYNLPVKNRDNNILYFGRLDESKGVDLLLIALAQTKSKIDLKIIGAGPQEADLRQLAKNLGLENRVHFVGAKHGEELIALIKKSLFTVFPSRVHETFGLGVIESQLCGKPTVASRVGAFPELVEDNQTGILFGVNEPRQIAEAIDYLLSNPKRLEEMGQAAHRAARERYSPEKHYRELMAAYNRLLKK